MDIQELFTTAKTMDFDHFKMKLSDFIRQHPSFSNLSSDNKKIILDLVHKHLDAIRDGRGISEYVIREETHKLYENRLKLKITDNDLEDIREIMNLFKK